MRPSSSMGSGSSSASPSSTSSPASSRASTIDSSVAGFSTSSTTTFEAESSMPVSAFQSTWMSSPDRNCFLAAARTASFIASMTKSRSIPCSWQSASIFCAIDELIYLVRLTISKLNAQLMTWAAQLLRNVYFQIRLRNRIQRNTHLAAGSIFKNHVVAIDSDQTTAEVALAVDGLARLNLRVAAGEALEVGALIKASFESRRRNFQRIGSVDEIFHVQNRAQVHAYCGAILVGNTLRLVNEYTNNRLVLGTGYLGVHQLKAMVDC